MVKGKHTKYVLLLRMEDETYLVCDEYYPTDNGRIHVLGDSYYACFFVDAFAVEYRKATFSVSAIIYQGENWPTPISGCKDRETILRHFGRVD